MSPALSSIHPEILAPAGNLERLKVAVLYGADAVYFSGQKYGLRAGADNFSLSEIREATEFAHQHGAKTYVVINSYFHNEDFTDLKEYVQFLDSVGTDAVIVSDLGVVQLISQYTSLSIHLSTQASCVNVQSALFWKEMGIERIVVGRELTIQEALRLKNEAQIEIEMFVHGAMCMSYSGHCTISNYTAGRDSNRGGCKQSCRFEYQLQSEQQVEQTQFFMSSKDLNGLSVLPQFIEAGIDSLKIEGRMKSNLYVATLVSAYVKARNYLLQTPVQQVEDSLQLEVTKIPHRGYTTASLLKKAEAESIYYHHSDENLNTYDLVGTVLETYSEAGQNFALIEVLNTLRSEQEIEILVFSGDNEVLSLQNARTLKGETLAQYNPNSVIVVPVSAQVQQWNVVRKKRLLSPSVAGLQPSALLVSERG